MSERPKKQPPQTISDQLRAAMLASGKKAYTLAKLSGVDTGMVRRFISGERDLRLETASKIAEVLNLHLTEKNAP
jgi:hypothetical protein